MMLTYPTLLDCIHSKSMKNVVSCNTPPNQCNTPCVEIAYCANSIADSIKLHMQTQQSLGSSCSRSVVVAWMRLYRSSPLSSAGC